MYFCVKGLDRYVFVYYYCRVLEQNEFNLGLHDEQVGPPCPVLHLVLTFNCTYVALEKRPLSLELINSKDEVILRNM